MNTPYDTSALDLAHIQKSVGKKGLISHWM